MTLLKILVIDDEKDIHTLLKAVLGADDSLLVTYVLSGEEALIEAPKFQPDLILLDFLMPKMTGLDTFQALKSIPSLTQVPIVFFTASTDSEKIQTFLRMGAAGIIIKPFDPWTLSAEIQTILKNYQETQNFKTG